MPNGSVCDLCGCNMNDTKDRTLREHHETFHPEFLAFIEHLQKFEHLAAVFSSEVGVAGAADTDSLKALGEKVVEVASKSDGGEKKWSYVVSCLKQLEAIFSSSPQFNNCNVFLFGSCVTQGSWDGVGDIDFALLHIESWCSIASTHPKSTPRKDEVLPGSFRRWPPLDEDVVIKQMSNLFSTVGFRSTDLKAIVNTRVPIVRHKACRKEWRANLTDERSRMIKFKFFNAFTGAAVDTDSVEFDTCFRNYMTRSGAYDYMILSTAECSEYRQRPNERFVLCPSGDVAISTHMTPATSMSFAGCRIHNGWIVHNNLNLHVEKDWTDCRFKPEIFHADFDVCCRGHGVRNSYLLREYLGQAHFVRMGSVFLKKWSKNCGINNSMKGFLSSYAVNIMWIHFLLRRGHVRYVDPQAVPVLPDASVWKEAYRHLPMIPEIFAACGGGKDIADSRDKYATDLGRLMLDFFYFFAAEFDWENDVVSISTSSGQRSKKDLGWTLDKELTGASEAKNNVWFRVAIEDPYEEALNLGRHLSQAKLGKLGSEFASAFETVAVGDVNSLLKDHTAATAQEVCFNVLRRLDLNADETIDFDEVKRRISAIDPRALDCYETENMVTKMIADVGLFVHEVFRRVGKRTTKRLLVGRTAMKPPPAYPSIALVQQAVVVPQQVVYVPYVVLNPVLWNPIRFPPTALPLTAPWHVRVGQSTVKEVDETTESKCSERDAAKQKQRI